MLQAPRVWAKAALAIAKFSKWRRVIWRFFAMAAGLLELRAIDKPQRGHGVATWHMMVMATAWVASFSLVLPDLPLEARQVDQIDATSSFVACSSALGISADEPWADGFRRPAPSTNREIGSKEQGKIVKCEFHGRTQPFI